MIMNINPDWATAGPDEAPHQRLYATISIAGQGMHLEAIETVRDDHGFNIPTWDAFEDQIEALENFNDCSFQRTEIDGRYYVLIATPFGN